MNRLTINFKKNEGLIEPTLIEVSQNFEEHLIALIKGASSLELIRADRITYFDSQDGRPMVRYIMELDEDKYQEFAELAHQIFTQLFHLAAKNKN